MTIIKIMPKLLRRIFFVFGFLLFLWLTVCWWPTSVLAGPPPLPSRFIGTVKINGQNPPLDWVAEAKIEGITYATTERLVAYEGQVYYGLNVNGDILDTPGREGGREGETVNFYLNGYHCSQTGVWHGATTVTLNLTAAGSTNTPTATRTPTPTATRTPTLTPTSTGTPSGRVTCRGVCTATNTCISGLICLMIQGQTKGTCRNPGCLGRDDCVCFPTATPTITLTPTPDPRCACNFTLRKKVTEATELAKCDSPKTCQLYELSERTSDQLPYYSYEKVNGTCYKVFFWCARNGLPPAGDCRGPEHSYSPINSAIAEEDCTGYGGILDDYCSFFLWGGGWTIEGQKRSWENGACKETYFFECCGGLRARIGWDLHWGKRCGEEGYDKRYDINKDGKIDDLDKEWLNGKNTDTCCAAYGDPRDPCAPTPTFTPTATPIPSHCLCSTAPGVKPKSQGNADCNEFINEIDFNYWLQQFHSSLSQTNSADFNCDGKVDGIDFEYWRRGK